jgi:hypothetical protein
LGGAAQLISLGIMDTSSKINLVNSKKSFFILSARLSFAIPLFTVLVTAILGILSAICVKPHSDIFVESAPVYVFCAFLLQIVSLILGIVSLFGIPHYGARFILWKSLVGILASCGVGFVIFLMAVGLAMGHQ